MCRTIQSDSPPPSASTSALTPEIPAEGVDWATSAAAVKLAGMLATLEAWSWPASTRSDACDLWKRVSDS